jgi:hemerythrin superfamily protein
MAETKIRARKATALLKEDHQKVKKLFKDYEACGDDEADEKSEIFQKIQKELEVHAQIEEEIFYPAIEEGGEEEASELVKEAHEEHRIVKQLLEELSSMTPGDEDFDAKCKVLMDNTLHHAEEEESEIFKLFDKLDKDVRDMASEQLSERKRELSPGTE